MCESEVVREVPVQADQWVARRICREGTNSAGAADVAFRRLVSDPTDNLVVQFLRYTVVGGFAFAVDFTVLVVLTSVMGLHYLISAALAFTLGLATNYALSTIWVFHKRTLANRQLEFLVFAGIGLVGLGLNEALMWLLADKVEVHYAVSKLGATFLVHLWNFLARRFCLFR
jgi:putative flippase GtrA